jgi:hypothetical protein
MAFEVGLPFGPELVERVAGRPFSNEQCGMAASASPTRFGFDPSFVNVVRLHGYGLGLGGKIRVRKIFRAKSRSREKEENTQDYFPRTV